MDCDEVKSESDSPVSSGATLREGTAKTFGKDTTLCDSLAGFWRSRMYADVRVQCCEGEVVDCHMIVLSALSPMVAEALEAHESDEAPVLLVPDVGAKSLETFMSKVYCGGSEEATIPEELLHMGFSLHPVGRKHRAKGITSKVKSEPSDCGAVAPEDLGIDPKDAVDNDPGHYRRAKASKRNVLGKITSAPLWHDLMTEMDAGAAAQQVEVGIKQEDSDVEFKFDDAEDDDDVSGAEEDDQERDPDFRKPATSAHRSLAPRGGRKRTSPVWEFFTTVEKEVNKCNICDAVVRSVKQNTTNMMKHLTTNHPAESSAVLLDRVKAEVKNEESCDLGTGGNAARKSNSPRKRTSMVWRHFSRVDNVSTQCQLCSRVMTNRTGSTTNMMKHLKCNHGAEHRALLAEMGTEESPDGEVAAPKGKAVGPRKKRGPKAQYDDDPKHRTCPDCKKEYSCRQAMLYHVRVVHSGVRPFCCQECGMTFARADSFRGHSHSLERTFLCSVCGKTFARRNIRDVHERAHYNDRRYPCSFCEKKFMTNQQKR